MRLLVVGMVALLFAVLEGASLGQDRRRVVAGMDVADALNAEYGEGPGGIRAGKQEPFFAGGNAWLLGQFPKLDYIRRAQLLP